MAVKSKLTFQISMEDLENFFDKNDFNLEIKNTIIQEFSKRYLKSLVDEKMKKSFENQISNYLTQNSWSSKGTPTESLKKILDPIIQEYVKNIVSTVMINVVNKDFENTIGTVINNCISRHISSIITNDYKIIRDKVKSEVDEIIKGELKNSMIDFLKNKIG